VAPHEPKTALILAQARNVAAMSFAGKWTRDDAKWFQFGILVGSESEHVPIA
jgi:hypothetical protein